MCHCIFFGINPRVSKYHAFSHHRVTLTISGVIMNAEKTKKIHNLKIVCLACKDYRNILRKRMPSILYLIKRDKQRQMRIHVTDVVDYITTQHPTFKCEDFIPTRVKVTPFDISL